MTLIDPDIRGAAGRTAHVLQYGEKENPRRTILASDLRELLRLVDDVDRAEDTNGIGFLRAGEYPGGDWIEVVDVTKDGVPEVTVTSSARVELYPGAANIVTIRVRR